MDEKFDQNLEKRFSRREILMEKYHLSSSLLELLGAQENTIV
jgi:hypothetical protein